MRWVAFRDPTVGFQTGETTKHALNSPLLSRRTRDCPAANAHQALGTLFGRPQPCPSTWSYPCPTALAAPGWDHARGPPPSKWERATRDRTDAAPTWGLKVRHHGTALQYGMTALQPGLRRPPPPQPSGPAGSCILSKKVYLYTTYCMASCNYADVYGNVYDTPRRTAACARWPPRPSVPSGRCTAAWPPCTPITP